MSITSHGAPAPLSKPQAIARAQIGFCGVWMLGLGVYFILVRPALLPEDVRYMGLNPDMQRQLPGLRAWLGHVFTVMGGFMAGAGGAHAATGAKGCVAQPRYNFGRWLPPVR